MPDYAPNQIVTLRDGRTMTYADYQQQVTRQVAAFTGMLSVDIGQMSGLGGDAQSGAAEVHSTLASLRAELSGIDAACGTDDLGNQIRSTLRKVYPAVQQAIENVPSNLDAFATGCHASAATLFRSEQAALDSFRGLGFHFTAVDPRRAGPSGAR
jgi:hypothetical protein